MGGQRIVTVFGTRPEAIKMAPVVQQLQAAPSFESLVCITAQHRHLLDQVIERFDLHPQFDLDVMTEAQTPTGVLARVVERLEPVFAHAAPDWVLVHGDTTTAMAAALAASYAGIKVGHVEAGLRTFDRSQPFPEELNRMVITATASAHFAPTASSRENLLREGVDPRSIAVVGNTCIDALMATAAAAPAAPVLDSVPPDAAVVLVTAHRRENHGAPLRAAFDGLAALATAFGDRIRIIYPVHPNPNVIGPATELLGGRSNVILCDPLPYDELVAVLARARLVITDSGGLQEEAPSLGVPVLVLRSTTERPEAVHAGTVELIGCDADLLVARATELLSDDAAHAEMAQRTNPYGDGNAAVRIVDWLDGRSIEEFDPAPVVDLRESAGLRGTAGLHGAAGAGDRVVGDGRLELPTSRV